MSEDLLPMYLPNILIEVFSEKPIIITKLNGVRRQKNEILKILNENLKFNIRNVFCYQ